MFEQKCVDVEDGPCSENVVKGVKSVTTAVDCGLLFAFCLLTSQHLCAIISSTSSCLFSFPNALFVYSWEDVTEHRELRFVLNMSPSAENVTSCNLEWAVFLFSGRDGCFWWPQDVPLLWLMMFGAETGHTSWAAHENRGREQWWGTALVMFVLLWSILFQKLALQSP